LPREEQELTHLVPLATFDDAVVATLAIRIGSEARVSDDLGIALGVEAFGPAHLSQDRLDLGPGEEALLAVRNDDVVGAGTLDERGERAETGRGPTRELPL